MDRMGFLRGTPIQAERGASQGIVVFNERA